MCVWWGGGVTMGEKYINAPLSASTKAKRARRRVFAVYYSGWDTRERECTLEIANELFLGSQNIESMGRLRHQGESE